MENFLCASRPNDDDGSEPQHPAPYGLPDIHRFNFAQVHLEYFSGYESCFHDHPFVGDGKFTAFILYVGCNEQGKQRFQADKDLPVKMRFVLHYLIMDKVIADIFSHTMTLLVKRSDHVPVFDAVKINIFCFNPGLVFFLIFPEILYIGTLFINPKNV